MRDSNWRKCVINADSRDVLRHIPDHSVDFILTDPPYNLGQHSTGNIPLPGRSAMNNDVATWDMVDFNPEEWAGELVRILKPTGNLFIFTSYNQLGRWYNCLDAVFDTTNFMVWHKTNPAPKIFKAGFLNSCEMIFTCWNKRHTWNFISQKEMHNFIESPICMRPERLADPKHPAQKPVAILRKMIEIASNEGDIVLDPFMGVGSVGVAALGLNRRFIGVEIDNSYFCAAKRRIDDIINREEESDMKTYSAVENTEADMAREPAVTTALPLADIDTFFNYKKSQQALRTPIVPINRASGLSPIIKWPGGKEKELKYIIPNLPQFRRYYEPFVGGGSVFMGIQAQEYFINDFSSELIALYRHIASSDSRFFGLASAIDQSWQNAACFFRSHPSLPDTYYQYRSGQLDSAALREWVHGFCMDKADELQAILTPEFRAFPGVLVSEAEKNLCRKMTRMRELEIQRHELPASDVDDNIETAIKSAVYMNYRHLYNDSGIADSNPDVHSALFFFIRNYAYSGMFRYSSKGDFNVPYGGIAYNGKSMSKKLEYYLSEPVLSHFEHAHICNLDFEKFLEAHEPSEDDFVFLDPPYDSEFSTYAQNVFSRDDQERLADYLTTRCRAKWMMIIKNTEFIYGLYNKRGIHISTFDKEYLVSFMNRNDKKVTHLLITNYELPGN